jgi:NTP pyrophosphatase (non-canonical NTP hydrolase)
MRGITCRRTQEPLRELYRIESKLGPHEINGKETEQMNITLKMIWDSSTGLLKRFDLMPSQKKAYLKMQEEIAEMQEALYKLSGNRKNIPYKQDAAEEVVDVLVTLLNVAYTAGLTDDDIEAALKEVIRKNDSKSHQTHTAEDGWIKKIIPVAMISEGE